MVFTPKNWQNAPSTATPINAAALEDLETRLSDYTDTETDGLAPLISPALTGTPTAPTQPPLDDSTKLATTAYTDTAVSVETARAEAAETTNATAITSETSRAEAAESLLAPKASPALTGTPTAPTASALTNNTQLATTSYTDSAVAVEKTRAMAAESTLTGSIAAETTRAEAAESLLAPKSSPTFTGTPTAPTPTAGDNSTKLATTAFVAASTGSGVSSFNTRTGAVSLTKADVTGTGLAPSDIGAATTASVTAAIATAESASDAAGTAAADAATRVPLGVPVTVNAANSPYTASPGQILEIDNTSGSVVVNYPTTPPDKSQITRKVVAYSSANTITINAGGSAHFDSSTGNTSASMVELYQAKTDQYIAGTVVWLPISGDRSINQEDARYVLATGSNLPASVSAVASAYAEGELTQVASISPIGNLGSAQTINMSADVPQWLVGTLNANLTVTFNDLVAGATAQLVLTQGGAYTLTFICNGVTQGIPVNTAAGSTTQLEVTTPDGVNLYVSQSGTGATGSRGSLWYTGSGSPGTIVGEEQGDLYLDISGTGNIWRYLSNVWTESGTIVGPTGGTGTPGTNGTRGSLWYTGTGSPGTISGQQNNDMFLSSTGQSYQLINGTWTPEANLLGPQGTPRSQLRLSGLGLVTQDFDLYGSAAANISPSSGRVYLMAVGYIQNDVVNNVVLALSTVGAGTAPTGIYVGVVNASGTVLAASTNLAASSIWTTTAGLIQAPLSAAYTIPSNGLYYLAFLINGSFGTTNFYFLEGAQTPARYAALPSASAAYAYASATSLAVGNTLTLATSGAYALWAGSN